MKRLTAVAAASSKIDQKQKLQNCQFELVKLDQDVKSKIAAVESCDDESKINPYGPTSVLTQLCYSAQEKLSQCNERIQELEEFHRALKSPAEKDDLALLIKRYKLESAQNLQNLRRATVAAMRRIETGERTQLMLADGDGNADKQKKSTAANLAENSASFTDGLTALLRTMDSQVRRSEETLNALIGSSQVLGDTEVEFRSMGANIVSSSKLLSKYGRREFTDRILFVLALLFFFGTVFYIVKKRLFTF